MCADWFCWFPGALYPLEKVHIIIMIEKSIYYFIIIIITMCQNHELGVLKAFEDN